MEKTEFLGVVNKLILPLFTGAVLDGETESTSRDFEVALGKNNTVLIKPNKSDEYRFVIKRGQPFKPFEVNILKEIVKELDGISNISGIDISYKSELQRLAIEKAIISSVSDVGVNTILGLIHEMEKWSNRTYEGQPLKFGLLVNLYDKDTSEHKIHYLDIINGDFFALLSDGIHSYVEFSADGYLLNYLSLKKVKSCPTVTPVSYDNLAKFCGDKRIGIVLTNNGDILVYYGHALAFAKRNGNWIIYSHEEIIRLLSSRSAFSAKDIRRSIYNTALDCSFSYKGGCLVYLRKDMCEEALSHVDVIDILTDQHFEIKKKIALADADKMKNKDYAERIKSIYDTNYVDFLMSQSCYKAMAIRKIIAGKKFQELDRKLLEELVSMDGATVVDYDGTIIAVGAILKIEAGSNGGGRLAAAMNLAKYGVSIKISQDGNLSGYEYDKKKGRVKQIFSVG